MGEKMQHLKLRETQFDERWAVFLRLNSEKIQVLTKLKNKDDGWITSKETPMSFSFCPFYFCLFWGFFLSVCLVC